MTSETSETSVALFRNCIFLGGGGGMWLAKYSVKLMVIHVLCIFLKQFKLFFLIVETTADYSEWLVKERC